jgi:hypothetical protein
MPNSTAKLRLLTTPIKRDTTRRVSGDPDAGFRCRFRGRGHVTPLGSAGGKHPFTRLVMARLRWAIWQKALGVCHPGGALVRVL